jgi:hypothetical protein
VVDVDPELPRLAFSHPDAHLFLLFLFGHANALCVYVGCPHPCIIVQDA